MAIIMQSFALKGIEAYSVEVEVSIGYGKPMFSIIGLADQAIREACERIKAAIIHIGYNIPKGKVLFSLAPSDIKKTGTHFDLPMAIGLLVQDGQLESRRIKDCIFLGEISLNGKLRKCKGILPFVLAAKELGYVNIILPLESIKEAALVEGVCVLGFELLSEVIDFLEGNSFPNHHEVGGLKEAVEDMYLGKDFLDVLGQQEVVEKAVIAAAGGHNLLMIGEPGCGKSMIASRIPTILPKMSREEELEVTKIYSISGLLTNKGNLIADRPFRAPHHNASLNALIGGGSNAMPGEISLAHNGVLFLDELVEFSRKTLEALRQPIEEKVVQISRVNGINTYPANFMLIAAMNPCPCGYKGTPKCKCSPSQILKYQQKLSGPILDRIDIIQIVKPINFLETEDKKYNLPSAVLKKRVESARLIQTERFAEEVGIHCNAQMTPSLMKKYCQLDKDSLDYLKERYQKIELSARKYNRMLRVARTMADLAGRECIQIDDLKDAR